MRFVLDNLQEHKVEIKVIPGAKHNRVKKDDEQLKVYVCAPALDGKANKAIIPLLAQYWGVSKRQLKIIKGLKSKCKIIKIGELS